MELLTFEMFIWILGSYRCVAKNSGGTSEVNFLVQARGDYVEPPTSTTRVIKTEKVIPTTPPPPPIRCGDTSAEAPNIIISTSETILYMPGERVEVECSASGKNPFRLEWKYPIGSEQNKEQADASMKKEIESDEEFPINDQEYVPDDSGMDSDKDTEDINGNSDCNNDHYTSTPQVLRLDPVFDFHLGKYECLALGTYSNSKQVTLKRKVPFGMLI